MSGNVAKETYSICWQCVSDSSTKIHNFELVNIPIGQLHSAFAFPNYRPEILKFCIVHSGLRFKSWLLSRWSLYVGRHDTPQITEDELMTKFNSSRNLLVPGREVSKRFGKAACVTVWQIRIADVFTLNLSQRTRVLSDWPNKCWVPQLAWGANKHSFISSINQSLKCHNTAFSVSVSTTAGCI